MKTAESAIAHYTLRDDGIVVARDLNAEVRRTTAAVDQTMNVLMRLIDGKPRPVLWLLGLEKSSAEGWMALIRRAPEVTKALAIVVNERTQPVLGAFPESMDALLFPVQVFEAESAALEWLGTFAGD